MSASPGTYDDLVQRYPEELARIKNLNIPLIVGSARGIFEREYRNQMRKNKIKSDRADLKNAWQNLDDLEKARYVHKRKMISIRCGFWKHEYAKLSPEAKQIYDCSMENY
jgi:hypothetical protein